MIKAVTHDGVGSDGLRHGAVLTASFTTGQYSKRYGFISTSINDDGTGDTCRVPVRKSFEWYKGVIASNGEQLYRR